MSAARPAPASTAGALPAFAGVSFAYFAYAGLFGTYAPLWFQHLGFSALAIGTLISLQSATRLFTPYAWAWLADHTGQRVKLLRWAIGGALLSAVAFLVSGSTYVAVAAVMVVLFLCTAGVIPLSEAALAHWVSREGALDAGRYGRLRMWGSIGFILSVTASGFALEASGVHNFPWFVIALLGLLGLASMRLPDQHDVAHAEGGAPPVLPLLRRPEVGWFFASIFATVLAHQALYAFFSLHLADLGYGKGSIGLIWALGVVVEVLWFGLQGRWFARFSALGWLMIAAITTAGRFAVIAAFSDVPAVLLLSQATHAVTFAAQHTACVALVSQHFGGRSRGRGQALYAVLGYGASGVLAGLAGGAIAEAAGYRAVFWMGSLAGWVAAGCVWMAMRASSRGIEQPK